MDNLDTTYENVIARLSPLGRLEWDLAVERETNAILRDRLTAANAEIERLVNSLADDGPEHDEDPAP